MENELPAGSVQWYERMLAIYSAAVSRNPSIANAARVEAVRSCLERLRAQD